MERGNRFKDLTGKVFGRLTVIKMSHVERTNSGRARVKWACRCICGGETITVGQKLSSGHTGSCGCANIEQARSLKILPVGVAAEDKVIYKYKKDAKKKNRIFSLTDEQFIELTQGNCYYCGCSPSNMANGGKKTGVFIYNGIDRLDSSMGYETFNCVPCCVRCNRMKNKYSESDFLSHVMQIVIHRGLNEKQ